MRIMPLAALALLAPAASHAATIETSLAAFTAALGGGYATTSVVDPTVNFVNDGTVPISGFKLANGRGVTLSGTGDDVYLSGFGGPQYGDGYTGQLVDSTNGMETLTFSSALSAFGFTVKPDDAGIPPTTDTLTFTLSDGTSQSVTTSFGLSTVQFFGFTGGPETSVTITASVAPDIFLGEFLTPAAVPEPATAGVFLAGLAGLAFVWRRHATAPRPAS